MKILNDVCTGVLVGTLGLLCSKTMTDWWVGRLLANGAMNGFSAASIYTFPYFEARDTQNHIAMITGSLLPTAIDLVLEYVFNSPDYINNPVVIATMLFLNITATKYDKREINMAELNSLTKPSDKPSYDALENNYKQLSVN
jgi:hypothetical protein